MGGAVYNQKKDQRELIVVCQRQFRRFLSMRDWGWYVLIQKTRGLIGLPNPEEELRLLEEQATSKWGQYQETLEVTGQLEGSFDVLKDDIKAMNKQLSEEQGNVSVYTDRQAKAIKLKAETEVELPKQQKLLADTEQSRIDLQGEVKAHSGTIGVVKKKIEDIELAIIKVEQEKGNKDHTIKNLQDEVAEQDELINKLNKEKKFLAEGNAKSNEDLIAASEKSNTWLLSRVNLRVPLMNLKAVWIKKRRAEPILKSKRERLRETSKYHKIPLLITREKRGIWRV